MTGAVMNFMAFCLMFFNLFNGLNILNPVDQITTVHKNLIKAYDLDTYLGPKRSSMSVTDIDGVYNFLLNFEHKNEILSPTSTRYWCEKRYYELLWDEPP